MANIYAIYNDNVQATTIAGITGGGSDNEVLAYGQTGANLETLTVDGAGSGALTISGGNATALNLTGASGIGLSGTGGIVFSGAGTIAMGGNAITGMADPTGAQDAATKAYVDGISAGLDPKESCRAATTANLVATRVSNTITADGYGFLSASVAVTGVWTVGDRLLVKNQTDPIDNGIYVVDDIGSAGTYFELTRSTDFDGTPANEVSGGAFTFIYGVGAAEQGTGWTVIFDGNVVVNTDVITFTQFSGPGTVLLGDVTGAASANVVENISGSAGTALLNVGLANLSSSNINGTGVTLDFAADGTTNGGGLTLTAQAAAAAGGGAGGGVFLTAGASDVSSTPLHGAVVVRSGGSTSGPGGGIILAAASGTASLFPATVVDGTGGGIDLFAGDGVGDDGGTGWNGGAANVTAGNGSSTGTNAVGGMATLTSGNGGASGGVGGNVEITSGDGGGVSAAGNILITSGNGDGAGSTGGNINVTAGNGGSSSDPSGGAIQLTSGNGGGTNGPGGTFAISGGGGSGTGAPGAVTVAGGAGDGAANGAAVTVVGGDGGATGDGGAVNLTGGATTSGVGGAIAITSGTGAGTNPAGAVAISGGVGGTGAGGAGGDITLLGGAAGAASAADGGNLVLTGGAGDGVGEDGIVIINGSGSGMAMLERAAAPANPVVGATPGTHGTVWVRTTGDALMYTDQNGADFVIGGGGAGTETLAATLVSGNVTGGTDLSISDGDDIVLLGDTGTTTLISFPTAAASAGAAAGLTLQAQQGDATAASAGGVVNIIGGAGGSTSGVGGAVNITGGTPTSGAGGGIALTAADGVTSGTGGAINLNAGAGPAGGGAINLVAGDATGGNTGGFTVLTSGGTATGTAGGTTVSTGALSVSGTAGNINLNVDNTNATTTGHISFQDSGTEKAFMDPQWTNADFGVTDVPAFLFEADEASTAVTVFLGVEPLASDADGGNLVVTAGNLVTGSAGNGGDLDLRAGAAGSGVGDGNDGGVVTLRAGDGQAAGSGNLGEGGGINITAGDGDTDSGNAAGIGGEIVMTAGTPSASGTTSTIGAGITLLATNAVAGTSGVTGAVGGAITITAGNAAAFGGSTQAGGNILLRPGAAVGGGAEGRVEVFQDDGTTRSIVRGVATPTAASDAVPLDYLSGGTGTPITGTVNTTSTGATAVTGATFTIPSGSSGTVFIRVAAKDIASAPAGDAAGYLLFGTFENSGTLVQVGSTSVIASHEEAAAFNATFAISGSNVIVNVFGATTASTDWQVVGSGMLNA